MFASKKFIFVLLVLSIVFSWYFIFYTKEHPQKVEVTTTSKNFILNVQPRDGRDPILTAINGATKEILVQIYLFTDRAIIDSLTSADNRGVDVRVIIECHPFGGARLNEKTKKELEEKNVETKCASDNFALTHEKMIMIDDKSVFILTQNLTTSSFSKNREYSVQDFNRADVEEIRKIFFADWEGSTFIPTLTNIIESPNNSRAAITNLISNAKHEVYIEMEVITDMQIINLLIETDKRIPVNIVIPTFKQLSSNKKHAIRMKEAGVEVKVLSSPYMHAKLILVDPNFSGGKGYIGSINFTSASIDENRELGIILDEPSSMQLLMSTFMSDWEKADLVL